MNNVAYNRDCLEALRAAPDNHWDLAICDPPYGIDYLHAGGFPAHHGFKQHARKDWDKARPDADYWGELRRVSRNQIVWGGNWFTEHLPPSQGWIVWDKGQHGLTFGDAELAWSSFDKAVRVVVQNRCAIQQEGSIHPCQKPAVVYRWLIQRYAKPGDKILDTHLGSGSSRIAAYDLGFDFTGYELDKDYFDAQEARFARHTAQAKLFDPAGAFASIEQATLFGGK